MNKTTLRVPFLPVFVAEKERKKQVSSPHGDLKQKLKLYRKVSTFQPHKPQIEKETPHLKKIHLIYNPQHGVGWEER